MLSEPETLTLVALFVTGLVAGFIDSIAGGGGLISLPVLLSLGISPAAALGTNKLQGTFGSLFAAIQYRAAGLVRFRKVVFGIVLTGTGALCGTLTVQQVDNSVLKIIIPILLFVILVHVLFSPKLGEEDKHARLTQPVFYMTFGFGLGFYDGFFGPGTGSFWALAYVALLGFNLKSATAHTKVMNLASNVVSLAAFALSGQILYKIGACMALGQLIGASIGSRLVVLKGTRFVRVFFLCVVTVTFLKMVWSLLFY